MELWQEKRTVKKKAVLPTLRPVCVCVCLDTVVGRRVSRRRGERG